MAIAFDNATSLGNTSYDSTHTISAFQCNGTDSHLVVGVYHRIDAEVTSVTANGNAMTARGGSYNSGVCGVKAWDYTINNASFNVVGNTPTFKLMAMSAIALSGVDQTTPTTGTPVTAGGYGTTVTASYTGTSGNMLLVFINMQGAQTLTASGVTQIHNFDHTDGNLGQCFAGYVQATGSSQTIGCTSGASDNWQLTIVEVAAASAPSSTFKKATVNASDVPATQTNFPSYVDLSRLGITTLAEAQSVRVYADSAKTTEWAREIVSATEMHVKVPSFTSTTSMYVDWDGSRADYAVTDTYGRNAVWSGYLHVYHLDANANDSTGATNGTATDVTYTTGQIGNAGSLNGTTSKISLGSINLPTAFSLSAWIFPDSTSQFSMLFASGSDGASGSGVHLLYASVADGKIHSSNNVVEATSTTAWSASAWKKILVTNSGSASQIYHNAATNGSASVTHTSTTVGSSIGVNNALTNRFFDGLIEEFRMSSGALSANWETTEYNNQSDEAGFWGTWSTVGGATDTTKFFAMM